MKKLILALCGLALSLFASAQLNKTFVYDDGTIQTGYFGVAPGQGGIYWSQAKSPTPYVIDSSLRTTKVAAAITVDYTPVLGLIPNAICNQASTTPGATTTKTNVAAGIFKPFVLTFGNQNGDTTKPFTVDLSGSSNKTLKIVYKKPATPISNYYKTVGSGSNGVYTSYTTSNITASDALYGIGGTSSATTNDNPLYVTIQVIDSAGVRLELAVNNPITNSNNYNSKKLGFTLSTAPGTDSVSIDLSQAWVLNYNNPWFPNTPYVCTPLPAVTVGGTKFSAITNGAAACPLVASSVPGYGFNFKKVAKILFFVSARTGGTPATSSTLGFCTYGPANFSAYQNTLTITSFSLGALPASGGYPGYLSVRTVAGSSSFNINWLNPTITPDSIAIARSNSSTGGWSVVRYVSAQTIGTVVGFTTIDTTSANYGTNTFYDGTVGGASFYKIGGVNKGLITWSPGFATVGVKDLTTPLNANTVTGISFVQEYLGESNVTLAPNPTNGNTSLKYNLVKSANISIKVFNSLSQEVYSTPEAYLAPGSYSDDINLYGKNQGLYFVAILVNGKPVKVEKLLLD